MSDPIEVGARILPRIDQFKSYINFDYWMVNIQKIREKELDKVRYDFGGTKVIENNILDYLSSFEPRASDCDQLLENIPLDFSNNLSQSGKKSEVAKLQSFLTKRENNYERFDYGVVPELQYHDISISYFSIPREILYRFLPFRSQINFFGEIITSKKERNELERFALISIASLRNLLLDQLMTDYENDTDKVIRELRTRVQNLSTEIDRLLEWIKMVTRKRKFTSEPLSVVRGIYKLSRLIYDEAATVLLFSDFHTWNLSSKLNSHEVRDLFEIEDQRCCTYLKILDTRQSVLKWLSKAYIDHKKSYFRNEKIEDNFYYFIETQIKAGKKSNFNLLEQSLFPQAAKACNIPINIAEVSTEKKSKSFLSKISLLPKKSSQKPKEQDNVTLNSIEKIIDDKFKTNLPILAEYKEAMEDHSSKLKKLHEQTYALTENLAIQNNSSTKHTSAPAPVVVSGQGETNPPTLQPVPKHIPANNENIPNSSNQTQIAQADNSLTSEKLNTDTPVHSSVRSNLQPELDRIDVEVLDEGSEIPVLLSFRELPSVAAQDPVNALNLTKFDEDKSKLTSSSALDGSGAGTLDVTKHVQQNTELISKDLSRVRSVTFGNITDKSEYVTADETLNSTPKQHISDKDRFGADVTFGVTQFEPQATSTPGKKPNIGREDYFNLYQNTQRDDLELDDDSDDENQYTDCESDTSEDTEYFDFSESRGNEKFHRDAYSQIKSIANEHMVTKSSDRAKRRRPVLTVRKTESQLQSEFLDKIKKLNINPDSGIASGISMNTPTSGPNPFKAISLVMDSSKKVEKDYPVVPYVDRSEVFTLFPQPNKEAEDKRFAAQNSMYAANMLRKGSSPQAEKSFLRGQEALARSEKPRVTTQEKDNTKKERAESNYFGAMVRSKPSKNNVTNVQINYPNIQVLGQEIPLDELENLVDEYDHKCQALTEFRSLYNYLVTQINQYSEDLNEPFDFNSAIDILHTIELYMSRAKEEKDFLQAAILDAREQIERAQTKEKNEAPNYVTHMDSFAKVLGETLGTKIKDIFQPSSLNLEPIRFSGAPVDFPNFWDIFEACIHKNASINKSIKLLKLKKCIAHLPTCDKILRLDNTDENYDEAIRLLQEYFCDPEEFYKHVRNQTERIFKSITKISEGDYFIFEGITDQLQKFVKSIGRTISPRYSHASDLVRMIAPLFPRSILKEYSSSYSHIQSLKQQGATFETTRGDKDGNPVKVVIKMTPEVADQELIRCTIGHLKAKMQDIETTQKNVYNVNIRAVGNKNLFQSNTVTFEGQKVNMSFYEAVNVIKDDISKQSDPSRYASEQHGNVLINYVNSRNRHIMKKGSRKNPRKIKGFSPKNGFSTKSKPKRANSNYTSEKILFKKGKNNARKNATKRKVTARSKDYDYAKAIQKNRSYSNNADVNQPTSVNSNYASNKNRGRNVFNAKKTANSQKYQFHNKPNMPGSNSKAKALMKQGINKKSVDVHRGLVKSGPSGRNESAIIKPPKQDHMQMKNYEKILAHSDNNDANFHSNRHDGQYQNRKMPQKKNGIFPNNTTWCYFCKSTDHMTMKCANTNISPLRKKDIALQAEICLNCLFHGHIASACNKARCPKCGRAHNSQLHIDSNSNARPNNNNKPKPKNGHFNSGKRPFMSNYGSVHETTSFDPNKNVVDVINVYNETPTFQPWPQHKSSCPNNDGYYSQFEKIRTSVSDRVSQ